MTESEKHPPEDPYVAVLGTDTTPTVVTFTLPTREVEFLMRQPEGAGVDYLGQYDPPAAAFSDIARRWVRMLLGERVKQVVDARYPDTDPDEPHAYG